MKSVSVVIPTYNRTEELLRSINTVIEQTYQGNIEIIIVDDSEDSIKNKINKNFFQILKQKKNRKIAYIHKAKKEGAPIARNVGIDNSKGDYVAFLDDDDLWLPTKIEKQVKVLDKNKNAGLVISYSLDKRFGKERISKPPKKVDHKTVLNAFNLSSSSTYLVRKTILNELKGFDVNLPSSQEYDIAIRISKNYEIYCIPEVLMIQNATDGQISENWNRKVKGLIAIYKKHNLEFRRIGFINYLLSNVKFIGMLALFTFGKLIGNRIYGVIIPAKEIYETK